MNKKTFFVITVGSDDFCYSYAFAVNNYINLAPVIEAIAKMTNIISLNACDTRREAIETAKAWNASWQDKGILWLSAPLYHGVIWN